MVTVDELRKIENSRKKIKKEIYTKIYEQFSRKIKHMAELSQKQTFLKVPAVVVGYPTYDTRLAAIYLKRQLELGGFKVNLFSDTELHVSWEKEKKKKSKPKPKTTNHVKEEEDDDFESLPSLMNLKKAASKYK